MAKRPESEKIENILTLKVFQCFEKQRGLRQSKVEDTFQVGRYYLAPEDLRIVNYVRRQPLVAFNPGAVISGQDLQLFPRLVFDYYAYASSIGFCKIPLEDALDGKFQKPIETKIIVWPSHVWDNKGTEDPRVFLHEDRYYILYTAHGHYLTSKGLTKGDALALALLDSEMKELKRGFFRVERNGEMHTPSNRDSAFLRIDGRKGIIATRPVIGKRKICWRALVDLEELIMPEEEMVPVFVPEMWESHIGWSTGAVKIGTDEYLIGWHGVSRLDQFYRNGLAVINKAGDLLGITNYVLSPMGLNEEYGDRPHTTFGNGLVQYKDYLVWVGGVGDAIIGFFVAEFDKVMEKVRWLKK